MENLSTELIHYIAINLTVLELKSLSITNQFLHQTIYSYPFWKSYIILHFPDYKVCDEDLILDQLKYLHRINLNPYGNVFYSININISISILFKLHLLAKITHL